MPAAHEQKMTHRYTVHFPDHAAREGDPHYVDFHHYHERTRAAARCYVGERIGFDWCRDAQGEPAVVNEAGVQAGLELHHAHVEYALQNGISLTALEVDYPGISNPDELGAWVESEMNFRWLCAWHHRAAAGAHTASHSDWEGGLYDPGLIT